MKEVWKDIRGYEGRYQISNMGHVLSLSKTHKTKVFNKAIVETKTSPKILKGSKDKDGYLTVYLGNGKEQKGLRCTGWLQKPLFQRLTVKHSSIIRTESKTTIELTI